MHLIDVGRMAVCGHVDVEIRSGRPRDISDGDFSRRVDRRHVWSHLTLTEGVAVSGESRSRTGPSPRAIAGRKPRVHGDARRVSLGYQSLVSVSLGFRIRHRGQACEVDNYRPTGRVAGAGHGV